MANDSVDTTNTQEAFSSRRDMRSIVFHLLYAMDGWNYQESLEAIVDNFNRGFDMDIDVHSEAFQMTNQIIEQREQLDDRYKPLLANWRIERLGLCTRLIMRLAIWELFNTDTAHQIVINEAIELAKCFAEKDAYKFINGILDQLVKKQQEQEAQ